MIPTEELSSLVRDLADTDASLRRNAAEALADADERAIYPLITTLHDENPGVQDAAMRALIAIGGEVTAYMALPLLREGPFLRNTARVILRRIGLPAVPLLRPLFSDKDDDIRTFALDLVADIGSCEYPGEVERLLETDPNQNVRASAARALGVLGCRESVPALVAALGDVEWVSFSALEALSSLADESAVDPVLALLDNPSEALRYAAVEALGRIGSIRSSDALIRRLPQAADMEKAAVIRSLVQIGMTPDMAGAGDMLVDLYARGEWEDRMIALAGLADLKYRPAIPVILDIAGGLEPSDPESDERLSAVKQALMKFDCMPDLVDIISDPAVKFRGKVIAIQVAGELGCREAVPALIGLLGSDLREVRRALVPALAEIGGPEALAVLRSCIDDRDGHVRSAAITELGRLRDRESFDHLLAHLDAENYRDVLEETVRALLRIDAAGLFGRLADLGPTVREITARSANDVGMLLSLSREGAVNVRVAALSSLGRTGDAGARARLVEALADENPEARKAAVLGLGSRTDWAGDARGALGDKDMWVRLYAVKAAADSADPGAAKSLIPLLYDEEAAVVLSVIDALVQLGSTEAVALAALQNHRDERVRLRAAEVAERVC